MESDYDDDGDGFTEVDGDCDDGAATVFPGAEELDNGVDDDCDGEGDPLGMVVGEGGCACRGAGVSYASVFGFLPFAFLRSRRSRR